MAPQKPKPVVPPLITSKTRIQNVKFTSKIY